MSKGYRRAYCWSTNNAGISTPGCPFVIVTTKAKGRAGASKNRSTLETSPEWSSVSLSHLHTLLQGACCPAKSSVAYHGSKQCLNGNGENEVDLSRGQESAEDGGVCGEVGRRAHRGACFPADADAANWLASVHRPCAPHTILYSLLQYCFGHPYRSHQGVRYRTPCSHIHTAPARVQRHTERAEISCIACTSQTIDSRLKRPSATLPRLPCLSWHPNFPVACVCVQHFKLACWGPVDCERPRTS